MQVGVDDGQALVAVRQFHEFLLGLVGHLQHFAQAVGDPAGIGQIIGFGERERLGRLAFLGGGIELFFELGDDAREQLGAGAVFGRDFDARIGRKHFDFGADQAVGLGAPLQDAKPFMAAGADVQHAEVGHVPLCDFSGAADRLGRRGVAGLAHDFARGRAVLRDQAHAEPALRLHAIAHHVHVARLEHAQRQHAAREQHRIERKDREFGGHDRNDCGRVQCAFGAPWPSPVRVRSSARRNSRWRVMTCVVASARRRASCSQAQTERCWPPVQPIATVR